MKLLRRLVIFLTLVTAVSPAPAWQAPGPAGKSTGGAKTANSAPAPAGVVDINHASKDDLKTLPGIGDAYANAIIKNRPYRNKTQLRSRNVIPDATYNKIKDKIVAKQ